MVVFTERGDAIRLIGAREVTRRERKDYEESEGEHRASTSTEGR